jgi:hypothetical protein
MGTVMTIFVFLIEIPDLTFKNSVSFFSIIILSYEWRFHILPM